MIRALGRVLTSPARWWSRSLSFRVVTSSVAATVLILSITGWVLVEQSTQGILAAKTEQSVSEASAVLNSLQSAMRDTDLRASNLNERLTMLALEAANRGEVGGQ